MRSRGDNPARREKMSRATRGSAIWALGAAAALAAASCLPRGTNVRIRPLALDPSGARWVERTLARMTLEEKIGQLIACRYAGNFYPADGEAVARMRDLVSGYKVGGMIVFGGDAYETAHLNNTLQSLAEVPLLIASDLERGVGTQITGSTLFPTIMGIGAADSEELAETMGRITALEGRALGIHVTYAPVVDVNINPDNPIINTRAIGEDPAQVARLAAAFIRGCQANGMIATAKHFPGHGDTDQDSHSLLPTIAADRSRLERVELFPYRAAIAAGVQAVMVSHLSVPALDPTPGLPTSLSPAVVTGLLRGEMGFKGLIVTDAMEMGGVTTLFSDTEAARRAVLAGMDMVLLPLEPEKVVPFLADAARSGRLPTARVEESARRVLVDVEALPIKLGTKDHLREAERAFEKATTLVKNAGHVLPIDAAVGRSIAVLSLSSDLGDYYAGRTFADAVRKRAPKTRVFYADSGTGRESLAEAYAAAASADVILCAVFSSLRAWKGSVGLNPLHVDLINNLTGLDTPVTVANFGSPYLLRSFPDVDAYLCFYRNTGQAQEIAARAIFGEMDVTGKLPVSIPGFAPLGTGIKIEGRNTRSPIL
jgi:beta-N-acetylhexosaminidase